MDDVNRSVPVIFLAQAINYGHKIPDPQGVKDAFLYFIPIFKNGKEYKLEVLYRESDKNA